MRIVDEALKQADETNRRLNRRCQKLESELATTKRAFEHLITRLSDAGERMGHYAKSLKALRDIEHKDVFSNCWWCRRKWRWKWRLKKLLRKW